MVLNNIGWSESWQGLLFHVNCFLISKNSRISMPSAAKELESYLEAQFKLWTLFKQLIIMSLFQPMSGSDILVFYSLDIFKRANLDMNSHVLAIFVQSGFLIGYIIAAFLMSRITRKTQFIVSGFFMSIFLFALGFILKTNFEVTFRLQFFSLSESKSHKWGEFQHFLDLTFTC